MYQLVPCAILLFIALQFVRFLFFEWEEKKKVKAYKKNYPKPAKIKSKTINQPKMKKTKKVIVPVVSHDEAESAMAAFARSMTRLKTIESTMEAEKQKIGARYMDEIAELKNDQEAQFSILQAYGLSNKDGWEGRSLDLLLGRIGFRKGNKKVIKDKKYSWDAVTDLVRSKFPKFVRVSYELDKDAILKMGEGKRFDKLKSTCFLDITQEETFYAEPKAEDLSEA